MPLSEESPCVTLYQSETTCRPDAVAELQGQLQKLQHASTNQPAETGRGQQTQCSDAGTSQLEECLDAFLTAAEEFNHLFHTVPTGQLCVAQLYAFSAVQITSEGEC